MTRREFIDDVNDFYDLKEFCDENGCDICEDVYSDDEYNSMVEEDISDTLRDEYWYGLRDYLNDLPDGCEWYRRNGSLDYDGLSDYDFEDYKQDVLAWADNQGDIWDFDEEADEEDEDQGDEDDFEIPDEDISVGDMMKACFEQADQQKAKADEEREKIEAEFASLIMANAS